MSRVFRFALLLFALAPSLNAQAILPRGNAFLGYSYNYISAPSQGFANNLNGWEFSGEGQIAPFFGIVGDYSNYYGTNRTHQQNFMVGPRLSMNVGRVTPFAQLLVGPAHLSVNSVSNTSSSTTFANSIGGGVDWNISGPVAWRFQGDYIHTSFYGGAQNNLRLSTGIVFRF